MPKDPSIAVRHSNGTYLSRILINGPIFGATLSRARKFRTKSEVVEQMGGAAVFEDCEIVDAETEKMLLPSNRRMLSWF